MLMLIAQICLHLKSLEAQAAFYSPSMLICLRMGLVLTLPSSLA